MIHMHLFNLFFTFFFCKFIIKFIGLYVDLTYSMVNLSISCIEIDKI
jgi:hypothetical protein